MLITAIEATSAPAGKGLKPGATVVDLHTGDEVHLEPGQRYVEETEAEAEARQQSDDERT